MFSSQVGNAGHAQERKGAGDLVVEDLSGPTHASLAPGDQAVEVGPPTRAARAPPPPDVTAGQDAVVDVHLGSIAYSIGDAR